MDKPMIGIRQADGSFYEILGDTQSGRKRLTLSAARSEQKGVRIELFRSVDGQIDDSAPLGTISLDDPEGLGFQDIEFRVDLDSEGQLNASAALPGQPPRTLSVDLSPFRSAGALPSFDDDLPPVDFADSDDEPATLDLPDDEPPRRSDSDILSDDAFASADLDTLDDSFGDSDPIADPLSDLDPFEDPEASRRSDSDILGDDSLASADLDTLDDFSFGEAEEEGTPETRGLDNFDSPSSSFDLGDLDAGFGEDPLPDLQPEASAGPTNPAEDWEKISLDDMEPMEFLDTGAEISAPTPKNQPKAKADDPFRMDDDEPLELGDLDSDLTDLSDLGDYGDGPSSSSSADEFDQDFLPPPALTENSPWDDAEEAPTSAPQAASTAKPAKAPKAAKPAKASRSAVSVDDTDGLDKMSLILSLSALSLLVLLILVLLFLNMIKAPQPPIIQPEVQRWNDSTSLAAGPLPQSVPNLDLGAQDYVELDADSVLEVPKALRGARVSMTLEKGDTVADATRRFGAPAKAQGNQLSW